MGSEAERTLRARGHRHVQVTVESVTQRNGVPYATKQICCATCGAVIADPHVRRAAA